MAAARRNDAELRKRTLLREMVTNAKSLAAADAQYKDGEIRLATLLYLHIAASRPQNDVTKLARQRLDSLRAEARQKLDEVDTLFASSSNIVQAFDQAEKLAYQYGLVPVVGPEMTNRLARQRNVAQFAAVLKEDEAKKWWELGQGYEEKDQVCCAFLAYEQAEQFTPAPSAVLAKSRLAKLKLNPATVESAATCRELQWCHQAFRRAEQLAKLESPRANELFAEIVKRSPQDSEVHRAASKRLE